MTLISPENIPLQEGWEGYVYREWAFPSSLIEAWKELAKHYGDIGIFISYGWFENWWKAFGKEGELLVIFLKINGQVKAIFPCAYKTDDKSSSSYKITSLTNDHTCYYDFIIEPTSRKKALQQFVRILKIINPKARLYYEYTDSKGENVNKFLEELRQSNTPFNKYSQSWAPWMQISGNIDGVNKNLSGRLRNTIKRCTKKAEKTGSLNFQVIKTDNQLDLILDTVFGVEFRSWKGRNGSAIKCKKDIEKFYRLIAHWAMTNGKLYLFILNLGEIPIASDFSLINGKTLFLLKPGYDEKYRHLSPGNLLRYEIIKLLNNTREANTYNFLGPCDPWKMEWTDRSHEYGTINVFPNSIKGWSYYAVKYGWKNYLKRFGAVTRAKNWMAKQ